MTALPNAVCVAFEGMALLAIDMNEPLLLHFAVTPRDAFSPTASFPQTFWEGEFSPVFAGKSCHLRVQKLHLAPGRGIEKKMHFSFSPSFFFFPFFSLFLLPFQEMFPKNCCIFLMEG